MEGTGRTWRSLMGRGPQRVHQVGGFVISIDPKRRGLRKRRKEGRGQDRTDPMEMGKE